MKDEILDIFDEEGNWTGTATWTQTHQKGLLHHVADGLIFKDDSKIETLLQKRSHRVIHDPGLWQHGVGGHIAAGETPEQGIQRELHEELFAGHEIPELKITLLSTYQSHDLANNFEIVYLFEIIYPGPFSLGKDEVAQIKWLEWNKVQQDAKDNPEKYTLFFRNMIPEYLKAAS